MTAFQPPVPPDDEARLAALARYDILDTPPEEGFDDITLLAAQICGTPMAMVTLVDRDRQFFKSELGLGRRETGRQESFCACAILEERPMVIEDSHKDERFRENPLVLGEPKIRFYAGAPLKTSDGHVLGTVCVLDTEPRRLEEGQIAALEALARQVMSQVELRLLLRNHERAAGALRTSEKLAAVARLASSMAHEMNNPLQAATNLLFVADLTEDPPAKRMFLKQAQEELLRISHLVRQTLRFHRQSERSVCVRLAELVDFAVAVYQSRFDRAGVAVVRQFDREAALQCFATDVSQVISTLLSNSLEAMKGGGRIVIRIRSATGGERGVVLTVADTGCGMTEETKQKIFDPFFSTKGAKSVGLGLWVSREILQAHHATVSVRSRAGSERPGTVFRIFFPEGMMAAAPS